MPRASRQSTRKRSAAVTLPSPAAPSSEGRHLEGRIKERIEKRLGPKIKDLQVTVRGQEILIEGKCATYYSKQLAQHAALGVIEDEQLENAIEVAMP